MLTLFYPPFRAADDVEMLELSVKGIRAYAEDLAEIPAERLRDAWRRARREHRVERWPTINAILEATGSDKSAGYRANGRRNATAEELARQEALYGFTWIPRPTDAEADHHRQQEQDLAEGRIKRCHLFPYLRHNVVAMNVSRETLPATTP